jgi:AAA family ATP:ADP antiporter
MIPKQSTGVTGKKRGVLARFLQQVTGGVEPKMWFFKFVPLVILQFSSIFAYTMLKNTKNAVFVRATGGTGTIFGFLKILVIWPLAVLFPIVLSNLTRMLKGKREKVPYVLVLSFLSFFLVFMFLLLPNGNLVQFPQFAEKLLSIRFIPAAIADGLGSIIGYWDYSMFYGVSEMVAVVFINMLSWGVTNEICSLEESKVFYPIFAALTAMASYQASGVVLQSKLSAAGPAQFIPVLQSILGKAVLALLVFLIAYLFIERIVMKNPELVVKKEPKVKSKPQAGFAMVWNNTYLRNIGMIVISYSLLVFMLEQCWYESIQVMNLAAYSSVTAKTSQINSVMIFVMSLLGVFLGRFPWVVRAMLPVVMVGGGGLLAVGLYAIQPAVVGVASIVAISSLPMMVVVFGCVGNVMCRSSKYTLFDATKEELFRSSTDPEIRSQGKAVIDVVCGRVGKSGSAILLLMLTAVYPVCSNYIMKLIGRKETSDLVVSKVNPTRERAKELVKKIVTVQENPDGSVLVKVNSDLAKKLASDCTVSEQGIEIRIPQAGQSVETNSGTSQSFGGGRFSEAANAEDDDGNLGESSTEEAKDKVKASPEVVTNQIKTPYKQIAPAIFVVAAVLVLMWGYAVLSIAPKYEENIAQTEGPEKARNPHLNLQNFMALFSLSGVMFGVIYLLLQKEVPPLLRMEKSTSAKKQLDL